MELLCTFSFCKGHLPKEYQKLCVLNLGIDFLAQKGERCIIPQHTFFTNGESKRYFRLLQHTIHTAKTTEILLQSFVAKYGRYSQKDYQKSTVFETEENIIAALLKEVPMPSYSKEKEEQYLFERSAILLLLAAALEHTLFDLQQLHARITQSEARLEALLETPTKEQAMLESNRVLFSDEDVCFLLQAFAFFTPPSVILVSNSLKIFEQCKYAGISTEIPQNITPLLDMYGILPYTKGYITSITLVPSFEGYEAICRDIPLLFVEN